MRQFYEIAPGTKKDSEALERYKVFNLSSTLNSFHEMGLTDPTEENHKVVGVTIKSCMDHQKFS